MKLGPVHYLTVAYVILAAGFWDWAVWSKEILVKTNQQRLLMDVMWALSLAAAVSLLVRVRKYNRRQKRNGPNSGQKVGSRSWTSCRGS
jgi:uncharacterized membrane protein